jgi:hypothetical protein
MMLKLNVRVRRWPVTVIASVVALAVAAGTSSALPPTTDADFDGNGVVDQGDLLKWSDGFSCGDPNFSGTNFLEWQRQLGQRSAAVGVVPEPGAYWVWGCLASLAGVGGIVNRRYFSGLRNAMRT